MFVVRTVYLITYACLEMGCSLDMKGDPSIKMPTLNTLQLRCAMCELYLAQDFNVGVMEAPHQESKGFLPLPIQVVSTE